MLEDYKLMADYSYFKEEIKRTHQKVEALYGFDLGQEIQIVCEAFWQEDIKLTMDFTFEKCLSEAEKKVIAKANTPESRKFLFESQLTTKSEFMEAISFGLEYAFNIYLEQYSKEKQRGVFIKIQGIFYDRGIQSPSIAVVAARCLWKILEFVPKEEIHISTTLNKYIFPKTTKPIPILSGREYIINQFKYGRFKGRPKIYEKMLNWYEEDLAEYNNRTEETYKKMTDLEWIAKKSKRHKELSDLDNLMNE